MNRFTRFVLKRAGWMVTVGAIFAAIGFYYSIQLYKNLRPDIEELLPRTSRSVVDLFEVRQRLKSTQNLGVLIFSDQPEQSKAFVDALVKDLKQ